MASETTKTPRVSRGTFIKGAAAATVAVAATGALTEGVGAQGRIAAPYVKRSPSGDLTVWTIGPFPPVQIAAFQKAYPNVKVTQVTKPLLSQTPTEAAALITGVSVPDAINFLEDEFLGKYAPALYDVGPFVEPYSGNIAPFKLAVTKQQGRVVSIPNDVDPAFLLYRADILAQAGVDVNGIRTYDDLIDAAKRVKAKVPSCATPLYFNQNSDLAVLTLEGLTWQQHSGGMADAQGNLRLDAPYYTNAYRYFEKAARAGVAVTAPFGPTTFNLWNKGQCCFMHFAVWWMTYASAGLKPIWRKLALAKQPIFKQGDSPYSMIGGSGIVVPAKAKRPDLGALFGQFVLLDPRGWQAGQTSGTCAPQLPASSKEWQYTAALQSAQNCTWLSPSTRQHEMMVYAAQHAPSTYRYPSWYGQTYPYIAPTIVDTLTGKMSAKDAQARAYHDVLTKVVRRS